MKRLPFIVKPYRDAKRPNLNFIVEGRAAGKRQRKFFETERDAKSFAHLRNTETMQFGTEAVIPTWLRCMAQRCQERLASYKVSIEDATNHFIAHLDRTQRSCLLSVLFGELLAAKRAAGMSKSYLRSIDRTGKRLAAMFPTMKVAEITAREINEFLNARTSLGPRSRNQMRMLAINAFNFAASLGYCEKNPAESALAAKEIAKPVGILRPDELARLLAEMRGDYLPYVAIGAFAGLRCAEILRLDWREVNLDDGFIEVSARNSKTSSRRIVKVHSCLAAWLRPLAKSSGLVVPRGVEPHEAIHDAMQRAGIEQWPANALRHSFASYHLAHFKDAAALALEMGHSTTKMIFAHYREVVRPDAAAQYWQIEPFKSPETAKVRAFTPDGQAWTLKAFPAFAVEVGTVTNLADALGVSRQTIYNWVALAGCPKKAKGGFYDLEQWRAFARSRGQELPEKAIGFYVSTSQRLCDDRKHFATETEAVAFAGKANRERFAREVRLGDMSNVVEFRAPGDVREQGEPAHKARAV